MGSVLILRWICLLCNPCQHSWHFKPSECMLVNLCLDGFQVKKAFFALVSNGVRAAPLWDSKKQCFVGNYDW